MIKLLVIKQLFSRVLSVDSHMRHENASPGIISRIFITYYIVSRHTKGCQARDIGKMLYSQGFANGRTQSSFIAVHNWKIDIFFRNIVCFTFCLEVYCPNSNSHICAAAAHLQPEHFCNYFLNKQLLYNLSFVFEHLVITQSLYIHI